MCWAGRLIVGHFFELQLEPEAELLVEKFGELEKPVLTLFDVLLRVVLNGYDYAVEIDHPWAKL